MTRNIAMALAAILCLSISVSSAQAGTTWLKCTLTQDIFRGDAGKVTTKPLSGSVIFIIDDDDDNSSFFAYREDTQTQTKLAANVTEREVTFYDGPLSDTINRVTGTFVVVASPFHEAHGSCDAIAPIARGKPKF